MGSTNRHGNMSMAGTTAEMADSINLFVYK